MRHRRWTVVILALAVPILLIVVLPASIALALQIPGSIVVKKMGLSSGYGIAICVLVSWASLAVLVAIFVQLMIGRSRIARALMLGLAVVIFVTLAVTGRSQQHHVYTGTFEYGFERSNFYPDGQCWRPAYWLIPVPELHGQMNSLGPSVKVKFIGDATPIGSYGHLGAYIRQVRVVEVLAVQPTQPCR